MLFSACEGDVTHRSQRLKQQVGGAHLQTQVLLTGMTQIGRHHHRQTQIGDNDCHQQPGIPWKRPIQRTPSDSSMIETVALTMRKQWTDHPIGGLTNVRKDRSGELSGAAREVIAVALAQHPRVDLIG